LRIGRALCIGVDTSSHERASAEEDACALAHIAGRQGFRSAVTLLGGAASRSGVREHVRTLADESQPGDLVLITFSGHGGIKACEGGACSTWVLADGSLHDCEMHTMLADFRPGVRVLVISDSCNGGVPTREGALPEQRVSASVLVLTACQQSHYADAAGMPGHFTTALLETWRSDVHANAFPTGGYRRLYERTCARMPEYQKPDYYWVGVRDAAFEAQRPFTV
jgi:hypothetical protein